MPKVALYFPYVAFNYSDDSLSHCLPLFIASCSLVSPGFCCIFTVLFIEYNLKLQPKYPQNGRRDTPPYTTRVVCGASTLAPSALHTRARLAPQMQLLDPPTYLAKTGLLQRLLSVEVFLCRQPRRSCRQGVQLPHSCPATRA